MKKVIGKYIVYGIYVVLLIMVFCSCDRDKYKQVSPYSASDGLAPVLSRENKWGYIDENKNEVIPCIYFYADNFVDGFAIVAKGEKEYGIIDRSGKEIIPFKYEELKTEYYAFREGLVIARLGDKYGIIDKLGKEIVPFKYDDIYFDYGKKHIVNCKLDEKTYLLDFQGNEVTRKNGEMKIGSISIPQNTFILLDVRANDELTWRTIVMSTKKKSDKVFAPREEKKVIKTICVQSNGEDMVRFVTKSASSSFADDADYIAFSKHATLKYELINDELIIFYDR